MKINPTLPLFGTIKHSDLKQGKWLHWPGPQKELWYLWQNAPTQPSSTNENSKVFLVEVDVFKPNHTDSSGIYYRTGQRVSKEIGFLHQTGENEFADVIVPENTGIRWSYS